MPGTLKQHSPNVWEYQPQAVLADKGGELGVYGGERLRKAFADDPETKILFYDVFRSGRKLIGIQAGEFADDFGEVHFRHAGGQLKSRCAQEGKLKFIDGVCRYLFLWQIEVPSGADETVDLEIECGGARTRLSVPPSPFNSWRKVKLNQQTVQKDYPFVWIRDHCLFHHRAYGFERIVIYDNGSANYAELLEELVKMGEKDLQILVVNWPFTMFRPFMVSRLQPNAQDTVSQRVAFNHGFQMLRHLSSYGMNIDWDEYLYVRSGKPLAKLIAKETRIHPYRIVKELRVPHVSDVGSEYPVRAARFNYFYINPPARASAPKYVYRMGASLLGKRVVSLDVHEVGRVSGNKLINALQALLRKPILLRRALVSRFKRHSATQPACGASSQPVYAPLPSLLSPLPTQEFGNAVMYHYEGINTMWKRDLIKTHGLKYDDSGPLEFDPAVHVKDLSVHKLLSAVGLTD